MRIHYQIRNNSIEIIRCFGTDPLVLLPEKIAGYPVRRIAAYAFSEKKETEEEDVFLYETDGGGIFEEGSRLLAGTEVETVILPDTLKEIGNYIFYGCRNLKKLEFSDTLTQIGRGAFTGCGKLRYLKVHLKQGETSCVKEILGELWQRIDVTFYRPEQTVKLVFPEHYEEAVENTPARILFTQHHGTGNNYRQCFYDRKMDYRKYDELFPLALAQDRTDVLIDLVFRRLGYPYELTETHECIYEQYVREHLSEITPYLVEQESLNRLSRISERGLWTEQGLESTIQVAAEKGKKEILGFLMNEKHSLFPAKKRKRFLL